MPKGGKPYAVKETEWKRRIKKKKAKKKPKKKQ